MSTTQTPRPPFYFEKNVGQAPAQVAFLAHTADGVLYLERNGSVRAPGATPRALMSPQHRARAPRLAGTRRLTGMVNYLLGNNPRHWYTNIPTFGEVTYANIYPGINLTLPRIAGGQLEYDCIGASQGGRTAHSPAALPIAARQPSSLTATARSGARRLSDSEKSKTRPTVYQWLVIHTRRLRLGRLLNRRGGHAVRFRLGAYDHPRNR